MALYHSEMQRNVVKRLSDDLWWKNTQQLIGIYHRSLKSDPSITPIASKPKAHNVTTLWHYEIFGFRVKKRSKDRTSSSCGDTQLVAIKWYPRFFVSAECQPGVRLEDILQPYVWVLYLHRFHHHAHLSRVCALGYSKRTNHGHRKSGKFQFDPVDSEIFARILFSRIVLKDILVMWKIRK